MNTTETDEFCPCESGLKYHNCCGVEGRTALNVEMLARIGSDGNIEEGDLTEPLTESVKIAATSPDLFLARYNFLEQRAYMVKMSPRWYQESVFLDPGRIKGSCVIEADFEWLESIADSITLQPMPMIFHTAFCGSTLMSQALHAVFNILPIREPECLSNVLELIRSDLKSTEYKNYWLDAVLKLLSKRYQANQPAVVKTNDYSNPVMIEILNRYGDIPSLFMYTPLNEFVAGCLKAESRRQWIKGRYQACLPHTNQLFAVEPKTISMANNAYSEMAAFYWSYNIALFNQAHRSHPDRLRSLDFNAMLEQPMQAIEACGNWFGLEKVADDTQPVKTVSDKMEALFGVYSKNSTMVYSPQQRRDDIKSQLANYGDELAAAEQLAQQLLADDYPASGLPGKLLS